MEGVFCVYIIKGTTGRYIGCTSDLISRLDSHNKGLSTFTKKGGPWTIEWESKPLDHTAALKLENLLKKQKGGSGMQKILREYGKGS